LSICRSWALPKVVGTAIEHHQSPDYSGENSDAVLNVQAAIFIVNATEGEVTGPQALPVDLLGRLNFYPEDIEKLVEKSTAIHDWLETVGG
jgi:HD-like signal output (HDOD) protein